MRYISLKTYYLRFFFIFVFFCLVFFTFQSYVFKEKLDTILERHFSEVQHNLLYSLAEDIESSLVYLQKSIAGISNEISLKYDIDSNELQSFLINKNKEYLAFNNGIFLFNIDGILIANSYIANHQIGIDYSFREYYQEFLNLKKPFISELYYSSLDHGNPCVMVIAPLLNQYGRITGFIGGSINLTKDNIINEKIKRFNQNDFYFTIYTSRGSIIVHPSDDYIGKKFNLSEILKDTEFTNHRDQEIQRTTTFIPEYKWYISLNTVTKAKTSILHKIHFSMIISLIVIMLIVSILFFYFILSSNKFIEDFLKKLSMFSNIRDIDREMPLMRIKEMGIIADYINKQKKDFFNLMQSKKMDEITNNSLIYDSIYPLLIIEKDDFFIETFSESALKFLNYENYEVRAVNVIDLFYKDNLGNKTAFRAFLSELSHIPTEYETFIYCPNNVRKFIKIIAKKDFYNNHEHIFLTFYNIHDDLTNKKNIKLLQNKFNKFLEIVEMPVCIADLSGNIKYLNPYFLNNFFANEHINVKTIFELFSCFEENIFLNNLFSNISKQFILHRSVQIQKTNYDNKIIDKYYLFWHYEIGVNNAVDSVIFVLSKKDIYGNRKDVL